MTTDISRPFSSQDSIDVGGLRIPIAPSVAKCPVCGAAGGKCVPDDWEQTEELRVVGDWLTGEDEKTFRVPHDVYLERRVTDAHVIRTLAQREGDMITAKRAKEIGLKD